MTRILPILAALAIGLAAGSAQAKPAACKDAGGKFTKCPAAAAAPATPDKPAKAAKCKDAKGKFTKCPAAAASTTTGAVGAPERPAAKSAPVAKPAAASTAPMASAAGAPAGATAKCKDGTFSMSKHHSGSCSHHGGVASWLQ